MMSDEGRVTSDAGLEACDEGHALRAGTCDLGPVTCDEGLVAADELLTPRPTSSLNSSPTSHVPRPNSRPNFGLPKAERIRSKKEIGELFELGRSVNRKPLRVVMSEAESSAMMVSVPKRLFKRAVDRNLLKRRIREAYRLNRELMGGRHYRIAILYTSGTIHSYATIESALRSILSM